MAGQRVRLTLASGPERELPIASCPCNGRNLLFSVRRGKDAFGSALFDTASSRQPITVVGPYGDFVLAENATDPAVFIAIEDGIAPIKSLIEHAVSIDSIEAFHLYWSVAAGGQHYHERWCRALRDSLDNFAFTPLIATTSPDRRALSTTSCRHCKRHQCRPTESAVTASTGLARQRLAVSPQGARLIAWHLARQPRLQGQGVSPTPDLDVATTAPIHAAVTETPWGNRQI
jgi:ferredoxin-NADP reductase